MFKGWQYIDTSTILQPIEDGHWEEKQDAMEASTKHHRVLFENKDVRILEVDLAPPVGPLAHRGYAVNLPSFCAFRLFKNC